MGTQLAVRNLGHFTRDEAGPEGRVMASELIPEGLLVRREFGKKERE